MIRAIGLTVLLMALTGPAMAHSGHGESGFLHPFTGVDHVLAAVGVGVWAFLLASRSRALASLVPASFLIMTAAGAVAGFGGIKLPLVEAAIVTSVFVIGGLIVGGVRLPLALAMAIVGAFAVFHGYAHAMEAPASTSVSYILGLMAATAVLEGVGMLLGSLMRRAVGEVGLRALGGLVLAGGTLVLMTN
ncbi:MAG: HupE/UreJ family protein [Reyranellaceae bacterium]